MNRYGHNGIAPAGIPEGAVGPATKTAQWGLLCPECRKPWCEECAGCDCLPCECE